MSRLDVFRVVLDDGRTDRWEARKGDFDGYGLEDGALVVKKDGAVVGVYSLAHLMSAVIE